MTPCQRRFEKPSIQQDTWAFSICGSIQLCWSVHGTGRERISPYAALSWSWASMDTNGGDTRFCHGKSYLNGTLCAQVKDINIIHATADQFGELLSANLRLSCRHLILARFEHREYHHTSVILAGRAITVDANFDCFGMLEGMSVEKHVVPVLYDSMGRLGGLIVEPTRQRTGQYCRVGEFSFLSKDDTLQFDEAVKIAQMEDSEYIEMLVDAEGLGHYVIDII